MAANDDFSSQLDDWLQRTADRYEVVQVLKEEDWEKTQVVYRCGEDGTRIGPFVRKIFEGDDGRGKAYERILNAQTAGIRLAHQPLVYECERTDATLSVVMEFIHGKTLRNLVEGNGAGLQTLQHVAPGLCEAVDELHEAFDEPIIHRDIKPSNVMMVNNRIVLIDLGIARAWREGAPRDTVRYGTPGYAPPEQFGYGQTSIRSDIYALGMTLAYCLTGEEPTAELRASGFDDDRIPMRLRPLLERATQFDPAARYATARELAADIQSALSGKATPSVPKSQKPIRFELLGKIWNILLAIVWGFLCLLSIVATISPGEDSSISSYSPWFRLLGYLAFVIVPTGAIAYLALDKRRLRSHPLFAGRTWLQEFLFCLALVFSCVLVVTLAYLLTQQGRSN